MISRDCDGCGMQRDCSRRYRIAITGDKVYCPDGTAHLIDSGSRGEINLKNGNGKVKETK